MKKVANFYLLLMMVVIVAGAVLLPGVGVCAMAKKYAALPVSPGGATQAISNIVVTREKISLDLRDIEVKDALKYLSNKANINIVPTNQVSGRITLMIKDAPMNDIFEIVIRSNGLAYEKIGSIYNVMTEAEYQERYGKIFDDRRRTKVFHLRYIVPDQAFSIIDSMKSTIGKAILQADSGSIMVLDTPENLEEITKTLAALERKNSIKVFNLKYARAEDIAKQLKNQLDKKNVGTVKADIRTNQIVVHTLPERMADIEEIVKKLDQKTKEVLISARIIQIKLTDDLSEGVQWEGLFDVSSKHGTTYVGSAPVSGVNSTVDPWRSRQQILDDTEYIGSFPFSGTTTNQSAGTPTVGTEEMHIGVIGKNDFDIMINYLKTLGKVQILSNPKLAVINNQQARIHVGERQAYITSVTTAGQTTTTVSEEVTFLDVGLQLFITPTINDVGYVTLLIKPEISSVIGQIITSQNNKIPVIDTSTAETTVMVKDGATIIVGGLRKDDTTQHTRQIPFLGSIPLLGKLFKDEQTVSSRSELLIMITAHIIEGDELKVGDEAVFEYKVKKTYKDYAQIPHESDLTEYEEKSGVKLQNKMYQEYPDYKDKEEPGPTLKPLQ